MALIPDDLLMRLIANGALSASDADFDPYPVVKLFTPDGSATWLLTELHPEVPDLAFGLCDLGVGSPELGTVSLVELEALRGSLGLAVERDVYFRADRPPSWYLRDAQANGYVSI